MPLPYRTTLRLSAEIDVIALAEREVQAWIETRRKVDGSKRIGFINGEFFEPGLHDLGGGRTLTVAHADRDEDGSRRRLLRFAEANQAGEWQVDAVALEYLDSGESRRSLIVEARRIDEPEADGEVDPPGLVKQLLAEQDVADGDTPVTPAPRLVGVEDVAGVFGAITDQSRSVSVVVASSPGSEYDEQLRLRVESLTSKLIGTASVFVLTPLATDALNVRLPRTHQVLAGHVRTFMPRVELGNPADGHNHRFLGPGTLAMAISGTRVKPYLQSAFAIQTRARQMSMPLPVDIRRQRRLVDAAFDEVLRASRSSASPDAEASIELAAAGPQARSEVSALTSLTVHPRGRAARLLERMLGRTVGEPSADDFDAAEVEHERLRELLRIARLAASDALARFEGEQERFETLKEEHDYQGLELVEAQEEIGRLADELHYMRMEMLAKGLGAEAFAYVREDTWDTPSDLSELALTLSPDIGNHPATERVVFTGDLDAVLAAQQRDGNGLVVQRAWKAVRVLHDYAVLKASGHFSGNVSTYLDSDLHDGAKVPAAWHARGETSQTMDQWGDERVFHVPEVVDRSGRRTMEAHFKWGVSSSLCKGWSWSF